MPPNNNSSDGSIEDLRRQVAEAPDNNVLHFKLGCALLRSGDVRSAIPELQRARQSPAHRTAAMALLAEAFNIVGRFDLAKGQRKVSSGPQQGE